jgi:DNA invertase Pin-like site-specific DNA recombinase
VDKGPKKKIALLYARVSTSMQVNDGISLDAQERDLKRAAALSGYDEVELLREEGRSGKSITGRPVLRSALERLDRGDAEALFVTRIDRLARSTQDFLSIIDRASTNGWRIVMLDLNLDTSSYQGRFVVTIMSALAEMERAIIAERQKDVHRDRREKGQKWGVSLGPKTKISEEVRTLIDEYREAGMSYRQIADRLDADGVPPTRGEKWQPSSIYRLVNNLKERIEKGKPGELPSAEG